MSFFLTMAILSQNMRPLDSSRSIRDNTFVSAHRSGCDENLEKKLAECFRRHLTVVPEDLSPDIQRLELTGNEIRTLSDDSFKLYPFLRILMVNYNLLTSIEAGTFFPLKLLTVLNLSHNAKLTIPSSDLFRWSGELAVLYLSNSGMTSFPNNTIRRLPYLKQLNLDYNYISSVNMTLCPTEPLTEISLAGTKITNISSHSFILTCKVDVLVLSKLGIVQVNSDTIAALRVRQLSLDSTILTPELWNNTFSGIIRAEIQELVMKRVGLSRVPLYFFALLRGYRLTFLNLSNNGMNQFYPGMFTGLNHLQELNLELNGIRYLAPSYFDGLEHLRVLMLNSNRISNVSRLQGNWTMLNLQELDLSNNDLIEIDSLEFRGLNSLKSIDLSANDNFRFLTIESFSGLHNLETIKLSRTSLTALVYLHTPSLKCFVFEDWILKSGWRPFIIGRKTIFEHAVAIKHISLKDVSLSNGEILRPGINVSDSLSLFRGLSRLQTLDLSHNPLEKLPAGVFLSTISLENLYLNDCELTHVEQDAFKGLESLHILDLSNNILHQISFDTFIIYSQLRSFNISSNSLVSLPEGLFSNMSTLESLALANNQFQSLRRSILYPIQQTLSSINISGNPFECNCELTWLVKWLRGNVSVLNEDATTCSPYSFEAFRGQPLTKFNPGEKCGPRIALYCSIAVAVLGLAFIGVIAHHNRWMLRYKFFLIKLAVLGYKEIQDAREHDDFEYDVNVIFTEQDAEWAAEHLRPFLAESFPHFNRNVFGDGDLILGMHILDAVGYVVENSFKTIVLLSEASVHDNWFLIKFRTAMDFVNDSEIENVVVIFLEDIADADLPFLVRLYLNDRRPYIAWVRDKRGQGYFWNELAKDLEVNLRRNNFIPRE